MRARAILAIAGELGSLALGTCLVLAGVTVGVLIDCGLSDACRVEWAFKEFGWVFLCIGFLQKAWREAISWYFDLALPPSPEEEDFEE